MRMEVPSALAIAEFVLLTFISFMNPTNGSLASCQRPGARR